MSTTLIRGASQYPHILQILNHSSAWPLLDAVCICDFKPIFILLLAAAARLNVEGLDMEEIA